MMNIDYCIIKMTFIDFKENNYEKCINYRYYWTRWFISC